MAINYNQDQLYKKLINVYTESSPNPNSMKFVLNTMLFEDESASRDYASLEEAADSPLAQVLFMEFAFVKRVFFTKNFVTLTKSDSPGWNELIPELRVFLKNYFEKDGPVLLEKEGDKPHAHQASDDDTEEVKQIKSILEEYIRPAVEGDGGAISFHSFDEQQGLLKVLLQGSCSGCPSSTITLKAGIENLFTRLMPGKVKTVVAENM